MMKNVIHELKYLFPDAERDRIICWLDCNCIPDPDFPSGLVSSIYYDTWDWKYLNEKINGYFLKTKVRLRWYSDLEYKQHDEITTLEVKYRIGGRREKIRIDSAMTGAEAAAKPLESMDFVAALNLLRKKGIIINDKLFPVFQVTFLRRRYIDPYSGSVICYDSGIHVPGTNRMMIPFQGIGALGTSVVELKGALTRLPSSLYPLADMGIKKSPFSKYHACYMQLAGGFNYLNGR